MQNEAGTVPSAGPPSGAIHALGFHAGYRCRNSGRCCRTATWGVEVEAGLVAAIARSIDSGQLVLPAGTVGPTGFLTETRRDGKRRLAMASDPDGYCRLLDRAGGNLCTVHAQLGPEALPIICRRFPRLALRRAEGDFVSFSCACPTAAAMLFEDSGPFAIVKDPPELVPDQYRPVDVRPLPEPRLAPEVPMPPGMNVEWEHHAVATLARDDLTPEAALVRLAGFAEQARAKLVRRGTPDPLAAEIAATGGQPHAPEEVLTGLGPGLTEAARHYRALLGLAGPRQPEVAALVRRFVARYGGASRADGDARLAADHARYVHDAWAGFALPLRRYLAARLFANHLSHVADGLRSILFQAVCHLLAVRIGATLACAEADRPLDAALLPEVIVHTDLLLVHPSDDHKLLAYYERAEYLKTADLLRPLAV